jgi:hypothetical protein
MDWRLSNRRRPLTQEPGSDEPSGPAAVSVVSRRLAFGRMAGIAVVGVAGGAVVDGLVSSPASAATTVETGAVAPTVVVLTDGAQIAVDASEGNDFRVTIAGDRTIATPSNPTDGQKIVFQVTQGGQGSNTLTFASGYEFGAGLPQPMLSTTAGYTDVLGFIYNAAKGSWLFAAYVLGFATPAGNPTPTPTPTASATPTPTPTPTTSPSSGPGLYRLFPSTNGPASPVGYGGVFLAGVVFEVTSGGAWLDGYWWWVAASGQPTVAQKFALWQPYSLNSGALVPNSTVTSGQLAVGQWNYVPLPAPLSLSPGIPYIVATGFTGSFPDGSGQYGSAGAYSAGITQGPLFAYSDRSGTAAAPLGLPQSVFSTAGSDPTASMPNQGSNGDNFWQDLQISTTAPAGASYRLWPNYPMLTTSLNGDNRQQTIGTEFLLSQACTLDNIWFYSPPGATVLPSRCAIWQVSTQAVVSGTDQPAPAWSGAAGSGWVSCSYSGVTLPAGDYKVSIYSGGGADFYTEQLNYFSGGGPGSAAGIVNGPLTAPNAANATGQGQSTYTAGPFAYPNTYDGSGKNKWVDVQVTPS